MATYAIGDIHGCYKTLQALLKKVEFRSSDRLWLVGDIINLGPASLEVLQFFYDIQDQIILVPGNHDLQLCALYYGGGETHPNDTIEEALKHPQAETFIRWILDQPFVHYDQEFDMLMVHAGIPPAWSKEDALARSKEIQNILQPDTAPDFLKIMYGDLPLEWENSLTGPKRFRHIVNAFTRMRYVEKENKLDLSCNAFLHEAPDHLSPWFEFPGRKTENKKIIFGHWGKLNGKLDHPYLFGLDTTCILGNKLTAMRLEDQKFFFQENIE